MVWYFIGVYIIHRCAHSWNIFQHSKRNFVSQHGHVISSIFQYGTEVNAVRFFVSKSEECIGQNN